MNNDDVGLWDDLGVRLWDEGKLGEAERVHLATALRLRGVDLTFPECTTLAGERDDEPVHALTDIFWNYDPAATCPRRRAFVDSGERRYVLVAYEDGDWHLERKLEVLAGGRRITNRGWVRDRTERWPLVGPLVDAKIAALVSLRDLLLRGSTAPASPG